ncbi:MAG: hypothetical protein LBE92_20775 [Chryseobacterium sp.]|jgi:hypothetical protein|uniref:hypothetical protein n=1 Tax=Chryseobacterium sp. TaxID=1871047 RepID=UPI002827AAF8|nr:hypothetical protein [Chryseobacterium sp.]MDR2238571.1 hypothetical protein [Chryseobacterium sp.]
MKTQITIFNEKIDLESGNVYVTFSDLSEECLLADEKNTFYINLPSKKSFKISQYIRKKDLSIEAYKKLIEKYNLKFIQPREIIDMFNELVYIIINEIENHDVLVIGTPGLAFDSIKIIFQELIRIAENYNKIFILVGHTTVSAEIELEIVNDLKLKDFQYWFIDKTIDQNKNLFVFKH